MIYQKRKYNLLVSIFTLPLTISLLLLGVYGCSASPETIVIYCNNRKEEQVINQLVEEYNKDNPKNKQIDIEYLTINDVRKEREILSDLSLDNSPDLLYTDDSYLFSYQNAVNQVKELTQEYGDVIKNQNTEISVNSVTYKDKYYAFPFTNDNGYFLWYNNKYLNEENVKSLESILDIAKENDKHLLFDITNGWYLASLFTGKGACGLDSLSYEYNKDGYAIYNINWDNDAGVKVFDTFNHYFSKEDGLYKDVIKSTSGDPVATLKEEKAIAIVSGLWMYDSFKQENMDSFMIPVKLPSFKLDDKECQMSTFTNTTCYYVNGTKEDKKQIISAELASYLTNKNSQLTRFSIQNTIPTNLEALNDCSYKNKLTKPLKVMQEQINISSVLQSKSTEGRYWDVARDIGQSIISGIPTEYTSTKSYLIHQCDVLRNIPK